MNAKDRFVSRIIGFNVVLSLIGAMIVTVWVIVTFRDLILFFPQAGVLLAAFVIMIGLLIHFVALNTGNHIVSWGASTFVVLLALLGVASAQPGSRPDLAVIAGISVLAYNESMRLSFAQRRGAIVNQNVYFSSAISIAVVGLFAAIGVQVAKLGVDLQPTENGGETLAEQNWWVLVSVITLIVAVAAVLFVPTIRRHRQTAKRVRPGQRIDLSANPSLTHPTRR